MDKNLSMLLSSLFLLSLLNSCNGFRWNANDCESGCLAVSGTYQDLGGAFKNTCDVGSLDDTSSNALDSDVCTGLELVCGGADKVYGTRCSA